MVLAVGGVGAAIAAMWQFARLNPDPKPDPPIPDRSYVPPTTVRTPASAVTPRGIDPADATLAPTVERAQPSAPPSLLALDPAGVWHMDGVRKQIRITQEGNALIAALDGVPHRSGEVNRRGRIDDARPPSLAADVPGHGRSFAAGRFATLRPVRRSPGPVGCQAIRISIVGATL